MAIGNIFVFFNVVEAIRTLEANTTLPSTNDYTEEDTGELPQTWDSKPNPTAAAHPREASATAPVPTHGAVLSSHTQTSSCFQNELVLRSVWLEVRGRFHWIAWIDVLEASCFQMSVVSVRTSTENSSRCYLSWKCNSLGGKFDSVLPLSPQKPG